MKAPKTRPPLSGMEDGHDSLKFVNRTMDHWNPHFRGCVIDNEPGFKVVTGINDDIHPGDQFIDILFVQTPGNLSHLNLRIHPPESVRCQRGLLLTHVPCME